MTKELVQIQQFKKEIELKRNGFVYFTPEEVEEKICMKKERFKNEKNWRIVNSS